MADTNPPLEWRVTPGLPLNWSWMHKPSVFLAVCQCERGGGSCRSVPRFEWWSTQPLFLSVEALWALAHPAHAALQLNKAGDGYCCCTTSHHVARKTQSELRRKTWRELQKLSKQIKWIKNKQRWGNGQRGCDEDSKEERKVYGQAVHCVSESGSGALCAGQSVAQWVRLSGARAKDESQRATRERWEQPAGPRRLEDTLKTK